MNFIHRHCDWRGAYRSRPNAAYFTAKRQPSPTSSSPLRLGDWRLERICHASGNLRIDDRGLCDRHHRIRDRRSLADGRNRPRDQPAACRPHRQRLRPRRHVRGAGAHGFVKADRTQAPASRPDGALHRRQHGGRTIPELRNAARRPRTFRLRSRRLLLGRRDDSRRPRAGRPPRFGYRHDVHGPHGRDRHGRADRDLYRPGFRLAGHLLGRCCTRRRSLCRNCHPAAGLAHQSRSGEPSRPGASARLRQAAGWSSP